MKLIGTVGKVIVIFIFGVLINSGIQTASAATLSASSCSQSAVQSMINSASNGDIIVIPSGTCTWSSEISVGKALTIKGSGTGNTIISSSGCVFSTSGTASNGLRITGIEFRNCVQCIYLNGSGTPKEALKDFRIDNCKFKDVNIALETNGEARGVLDHNIFEDSYGARIYGSNSSSATFPQTLGTQNAVFFEDNTITMAAGKSVAHFIASNSWSKYVLRYNSFSYNASLWDLVDAHGYCEVAGRGSATWEIYNNSFTLSSAIDRIVHIRGGQGVVFGNKINGSSGWPIVIEDYRGSGDSNCYEGACTSYPCKDQVNNSYFWDNLLNGKTIVVTNDTSTYIQLGRDYWNNASSTYTPYTYPHPLVSGVDVLTPPSGVKLVQ